MKIVVPMAGRGARFSERGIEMPKPMIPIAGRPMVAWALLGLRDLPRSQLIFVVLAEHEEHFGVTAMLRSQIDTAAAVVLLDDVTEGQLCTVLAARDWIDTDEDVLIASSDTYVISDLGRKIANRQADCHGIISVANMPGDHWSFARTDGAGQVVEVAEKVRISNHASTGLYYFARGRELVEAGDAMIRCGEKTRGEYYVIPVYRSFIRRGWRVEVAAAREMWDMGTPEALGAFTKHLAQDE